MAEHILEALREAGSPLTARQVASRVAQRSGLGLNRREVNRLLYGPLSASVERDDANRWRLAPGHDSMVPVPTDGVGAQGAATKTTGANNVGRLWSEEEIALVYWALPTMKQLMRATSRPFASVAMKMANLLAVDTEGVDGLGNASQLDRAVVARYAGHRDDLEVRALDALLGQGRRPSRVDEIRPAAERVLRTHGVPLHFELVASIMTARDPLATAPASAVRDALRTSPHVRESPAGVFEHLPSTPPSR